MTYKLNYDWLTIDDYHAFTLAGRAAYPPIEWKELHHPEDVCPVDPGTVVEARLRNGDIIKRKAGGVIWKWSLSYNPDRHDGDVMAWRVAQDYIE